MRRAGAQKNPSWFGLLWKKRQTAVYCLSLPSFKKNGGPTEESNQTPLSFSQAHAPIVVTKTLEIQNHINRIGEYLKWSYSQPAPIYGQDLGSDRCLWRRSLKIKAVSYDFRNLNDRHSYDKNLGKLVRWCKFVRLSWLQFDFITQFYVSSTPGSRRSQQLTFVRWLFQDLYCFRFTWICSRFDFDTVPSFCRPSSTPSLLLQRKAEHVFNS